ncbi:MAG TPA: glutamate synthase [Sorangium sp.]|nr:glutamate synthase [Sorangium sp.]
MSELLPMPLATLARRALTEHARVGAVFDLPERKWYRGDPALDLSVGFHGARASTPLGPAAGPQSQLAQNIILSWLGGSRIIELKTVQVMDELHIARPCIDATNVGYNIEWSQELRVQQSLDEYVSAWMLLQLLRQAGVTESLAEPRPHTLFDLSVGYNLEGIRSDKVSTFIRGMRDASDTIARLRRQLTGDLKPYADIHVPALVSDCVTLSTFHGCPAKEIESICRYLLQDLGMHVVIKMNPTLLGYREVCALLNERLGYRDISPIEAEFDSDLKWDEALAMVGRLRQVATDCGLTLGAKFTNTLVVNNHRRFFPGEERMYMSGPPLHPISLSLALKFREAVGAAFPISFSAGIDARNFVDAAACGLTPITSCTDLLRPGGYGRLFKYLGNLEQRMRKLGVADIPSFIARAEGAADAGIHDSDEASLFNMRKIVARTLDNARYTFAKNSSVPRKIGSQLVLFDCISCDKCIPVCPNDANFVYRVRAQNGFTEQAYLRDGELAWRPDIPFIVAREQQIGNYADFCNDCGNCDVFCPEDGGPYILKPRFFSSLARFEQYAKHGGFYIEASRDVVRAWARIDGADYRLVVERAQRRARFDDGVFELILEPDSGAIEGGRVLAAAAPPPSHTLSTHPARVLLCIVRGVLDSAHPNPVNAPLLDIG